MYKTGLVADLKSGRIYLSLPERTAGVVELEFNFTHEGLIVDATDRKGENIATFGQTYEELIGTLFGWRHESE